MHTPTLDYKLAHDSYLICTNVGFGKKNYYPLPPKSPLHHLNATLCLDEEIVEECTFIDIGNRSPAEDDCC